MIKHVNFNTNQVIGKSMNVYTIAKSISAFIFILFLSSNISFGQKALEQEYERCGSMESLERRLEADPSLEQRMKLLEKSIQEYINDPARELNGTTVVIPTVFHIIHNGDAVGSNENISDVYINAQLDQLNDDFRRLNSDADNTWPQAADTDIEFCLAQSDPNGNPTTGIIRHNISGGPWDDTNFDSQVKPSTIWDRNNYLNFWTADLSGFLGYAQFPGGSANTDGVVCLYSSVGSLATPNPAGGDFDAGRTGTHEVGHWLNLRHIWGDGGCNVDDFVADTPASDASNFGCPTTHASCNTTDMVQNYMDYTDDACMNLFTQGQKDRMQAVLAVDGARSSLRNAVCSTMPVAPTANFTPDSGTETTCDATAVINFSDASSGVPTSWSWTFSGAGVSPTSSTSQNPTVTATASGNLVASLTVTNALGNDTHTGTIDVDFLPASDPFCQTTPCLDFDGGPYTNFNYADACAQAGCPNITTSFEVWQSEAYTFAGLIGGLNYTFEFCTGYNASSWDAVITIGEYDVATDAAVPNSHFAVANGCTISFTAPADGDYIAVISGSNNCGAAQNNIDNGSPTFTCNTQCVTQCGMLFTDSGGVDFNYRNSENKTYTLCPDNPGCEVVEVDFTFFDLRGNGDSLTAFDGNNSSSAQLGVWTGNSAGPTTLSSSHATGCLTFTFASNGNRNDPGWEANVTCVDTGACACPDDFAGVNALSGSESGSGGQNGNGDYETDGVIESTQIINSGTVDYDSAECVELNNGFEVVTGAEVDIFIDGCNDGEGGNTLTQQQSNINRYMEHLSTPQITKEKVARRGFEE